MPRTKRRIVLAVLAAAALLGAGGYAWFGARPAVVTVETVRGPAVKAVYATGNVEPVNWAKITSVVSGRIVDLCLCEGRPIKRGGFLARLDDREMRAQLKELELRAQFLEDEVNRYKALIGKNFVSRQNYDRAISEHTQAQAAVNAAKKRLDDMVLRAPMDGVVLRRDGEVGEIAEPGQVLFWVGRPKPLWVVAEVDEEDIPLVRRGQATLIKADAFPGQALNGTVEQITPKGDPVNKTYRVRIALPDDTPLLVGMTTEVNIVVIEHKDALLVPATAVRAGQVWVVEAGRAQPKAVRVGIVGDRMTEIVDGLADGARVVAAPPANLKSGARVREARQAAGG
ncbi:MAG: efflux RND transporter periplasmic adaptor subunit [Alphaproteobacteria bacterium]|nr:efflux RND transporter periplasmic adaptor subunit [Alphaproteobacteria bacterium]